MRRPPWRCACAVASKQEMEKITSAAQDLRKGFAIIGIPQGVHAPCQTD